MEGEASNLINLGSDPSDIEKSLPDSSQNNISKSFVRPQKPMVTQDIMADVELLSGLKFLKMVIFKEILFNFK